MIYKKPQNAMYMLDLVVEGGGVLNWVRDVKAFLHSLPAEFEIVEPGNVQVRWPEGFTRERLKVLVAEAPWQRAGVDDWRCRECLATVFRGIYPTAFGHAAHCSHSIRDVVDRAEKAERRAERLKGLLRSLHALVWGECPSLLNEDSGGSSHLDADIRAEIKGE